MGHSLSFLPVFSPGMMQQESVLGHDAGIPMTEAKVGEQVNEAEVR